jgi:hypothetical protein
MNSPPQGGTPSVVLPEPYRVPVVFPPNWPYTMDGGGRFVPSTQGGAATKESRPATVAE